MTSAQTQQMEYFVENVLRRMDSMNRHHPPADAHMDDAISRPLSNGVPATSSSAWTPLLRLHLETIQPHVDKWRGTLDTILLFVCPHVYSYAKHLELIGALQVALFSAVVTTFFVQSLIGLSEDPGVKTNQLIANLTDIILLVHDTNTNKLNLTKIQEFKPEAYVRTGFYWSLALILSISIACLAVTMRGFLAKTTRSQHTQACQKLTDLRYHWKPHLQHPPPKHQSAPFVERKSPTFGRLLSLIQATIHRTSPAPCSDVEAANGLGQGQTAQTSVLAQVNAHPIPSRPILLLDGEKTSRSIKQDLLLGMDHHSTFHSVLCTTHDDDVLDQAIVALPSLLEERRRAISPGQTDLCVTEEEYSPSLIIDLIDTLCVAGRRTSASRPKMTLAMLALLDSITKTQEYGLDDEDGGEQSDIVSLKSNTTEHQEYELLSNRGLQELCAKAPLLALLFMPFEGLQLTGSASDREHLRLQVVNFAYHGLVSQLKDHYLERRYAFSAHEVRFTLLRLLGSVVDIPAVFHLRFYRKPTSEMPILLALIPTPFGTGRSTKGPNHNCHMAILQMIFTPTISRLSLDTMVGGIRHIAHYHKDHFPGTHLESLDIFLATQKCLQFLGAALDFYHEEKPGTKWDSLFDVCGQLVQHLMFDSRHHPYYFGTSVHTLKTPTGPSPPRLLHVPIVLILQDMRRMGCQLLKLSDDTRSFLLSIETGKDRAKYYSDSEKVQLLNAFRDLDPSLPPYPPPYPPPDTVITQI
ncbi:hypothetical protein DXG01_011615 [Tephrocybe rancida]|nr:hypothetical protein DXG01_011615 [Tephrocybe rancida]